MSPFPQFRESCAQVKHLGYAAARRIRLYGEEFEVVSDPFPEADGVAVHVTTKKDPSIRLASECEKGGGDCTGGHPC